MRPLTTFLVALLLPAAAHAQGQIIPRPCAPPPPPPPPPECRGERCPDIARPVCLPGNAIVRTSSAVRVEMVNRVLRYEVDETFVNRGGGIGEADYIFPLPKGAAFERLELSINGEMVSGETMGAGEARRIYEEIVRRQRDPALVEWMGTGLLRARIFPINPGEEKRVVVRFQSVAEREGSAVRVDYVRGTAPSNTPWPMPVLREGPEPNRPLRADPQSTFALTYAASSEFGSPYSPTHALTVSERAGKRVVRADGEGREITILLPLRRTNEASLTVLTHRAEDRPGFALITITPPAVRSATLPRDVTFVVDVSGSMRGEKLEQAKAAGRALLESLERGDRFRLIDFSTDVRTFRDGFVPATSENLRAARRYLESLTAEGSTNISGALEVALGDGWRDARVPAGGDQENHDPDERIPDRRSRERRLPLVVFLTDGEPTVGERNPERIAALAARHRGDTRLFSVGVSADVNAALIEQLAVEGRGTAHFVRSGESVERAVSLLATRLTSPVLTDVRVSVDGIRLTQLHPILPQDLFAGQDLVLLARYTGSGRSTIRVEGRSPSGVVRWSSPASFPARERANAFVPRLWASQRIGWLAAERRRHGATRELDEELKSLGQEYGIPTELTSYLVLEPGTNVVTSHPAVVGAGTAPPTPAPVVRDRADVMRLRSVVVDAATQSAPAPAANEARFEQARQAAAQREAKSLADLDRIAGASQQSLRQAAGRQFAQQGKVWTDQRYVAGSRTVRVKAYSPLYFELLTRLPGLQEALALGEEVLVAGHAVAIQVGPEGMERMTPRELDELAKAWQQ